LHAEITKIRAIFVEDFVFKSDLKQKQFLRKLYTFLR